MTTSITLGMGAWPVALTPLTPHEVERVHDVRIALLRGIKTSDDAIETMWRAILAQTSDRILLALDEDQRPENNLQWDISSQSGIREAPQTRLTPRDAPPTPTPKDDPQ